VGEPTVITTPSGQTASLIVTPSTSPQSAQTAALVRRLRGEVIPEASAHLGVDVLVGGVTAANVDQSDFVAGRIGRFIAGIILLSLVLLTLVFRAPVVAIKAAVMNLLSVGAAYGVVAVFASGGFLGRLIGIDTDTPVPAFIPVLMFAILFGLSMDYEVFLLSRIRERYLAHNDTRAAITEGVGLTARVITVAALIMTAVFLAFVTDYDVFVKLAGVGLATAVVVDATVIRLLLVPAMMQLLGESNWWAPRWLKRRAA
jgi:RND superfamily putative drug exporter